MKRNTQLQINCEIYLSFNLNFCRRNWLIWVIRSKCVFLLRLYTISLIIILTIFESLKCSRLVLVTIRPKLKRSPFHDISPATEKNTHLDYWVLLSGKFWWTEFDLLTHFKKLHQTLEFFFSSGIQILRSGLKTVNPSAALCLFSVSFSVFGYRYPHETLLGAKRNWYLVFHKSRRHLSAFNNNKHTDLASWKSDKSTYFVNSLLFFFFLLFLA